jgi:hypothetical protein
MTGSSSSHITKLKQSIFAFEISMGTNALFACLNTNICSYLETGGQSYNPYLNVGLFFNTSLK